MQGIAPYHLKDLLFAQKACADVHSRAGKDGLLPLHPACRISIIVPIYDESIDRLKKQIYAFSLQRLSKDRFELVYVVNNTRNQTSSAQRDAFRRNQRALRFLRRSQSVRVRTIDCSSLEYASEDNSVGLARDIGLHLVTARYLSQERDGILIHTDADTLPTRKTYLSTVLKDLSMPNRVGAAGGIRYVLDIDSQKEQDRAHVRKHFETIREYFTWKVCVTALHRKDLTVHEHPLRFSGAHMIAKGIASVSAGGFPHKGLAEDTEFGERLQAFAKSREADLLPRRDQWVLTTAFRESTRTDASFWRVFALIKKYHDHPPVPSVFAPIYFEYVNDFLSSLQQDRGDLEGIKRMMRCWNVTVSSRKVQALQLLSRMLQGAQVYEERVAVLRVWKKLPAHTSYASLILDSYQVSYPPVPLTKKRLAELKRLTFQDPKRKAIVEYELKEYFSLNASK